MGPDWTDLEEIERRFREAEAQAQHAAHLRDLAIDYAAITALDSIATAGNSDTAAVIAPPDTDKP